MPADGQGHLPNARRVTNWACYITLFFLSLIIAHVPLANAQLHPTEPSRYHNFPSLREQARIQDEWRKERMERLPELMERFGIDVWLVSDPSKFACGRRTDCYL
jgi:hypothetical protein